MTSFEVTRDVIQFSVGTPVTFDVVPTTVSFTTGARDGADGTSFTARGPWDSGNTYALGDVVSFDGANYILYAESPTGDDPSVDTAHWDTFGSGSGVSPSRSIATTSPLAGGGDLSADRTLSLNIGTGLTTSGGNLVPDFGSGSGKVTQGNDSRLSDARTPTSHASSHADGGSDEIAVGLAQLTQSGATTGQVPKWNGSAWSPDDETGGGSSLPDPTGNEGAVLGTDGSTWAPTRHIESPDGRTWLDVQEDGIASSLTAQDGTESGQLVVQSGLAELAATDGTNAAYVDVHSNGTVEINATGAVTVTPGDGFHVVGSIGETFLTGDDWGMSTASDVPETAPGASSARARGDMETPTVVADGDALVYPVYAQGFDGTGQSLAAMIVAKVAGTVDTGKVPGLLLFATADADGVLTDRLVLNPDGTSELNGTLLDLDTSGASTGDVATWDGSKIVLDTPTGGGGGGGGGGLILIDSGAFSGASSVSLPNGSFSSTYDDYKLIFVPTAFSTTGSVTTYLRFRDSGSDDTSSIYAYARGYSYNGGGGDQGAVSADAITIGDSGGPPLHRTSMDIMSPNLAELTSVIASTTMDQGTGYFILTYVGAHVRSTTQYDALTIYPSTGTITGRWALYGYAK